MTEILAQHPPAVKVGGRRLSTCRSKHHLHHEQLQTESAAKDDSEGPTDYPRPNPPAEFIASDEQQLNHVEHEHARYEEEVPKNEKKQYHGYEIENRLRTAKQDGNRPTRDNFPMGSAPRRIDQPVGRGFVV